MRLLLCLLLLSIAREALPYRLGGTIRKILRHDDDDDVIVAVESRGHPIGRIDKAWRCSDGAAAVVMSSKSIHRKISRDRELCALDDVDRRVPAEDDRKADSISRSSSRRHHVGHLLAILAAGSAGAIVSRPLPVKAENPPLNRSLVSLLRIQGNMQALRDTLEASTDQAPTEVNRLVKYVVKEMRMKESVNEASSYLPPDRLETARRHGMDSFEYLSQIVEFSGFDEMKKPGVSKFNVYDKPERVDFARNCLAAASRELDSFLRAFSPEVIASAKELYQLYFGGG